MKKKMFHVSKLMNSAPFRLIITHNMRDNIEIDVRMKKKEPKIISFSFRTFIGIQH